MKTPKTPLIYRLWKGLSILVNYSTDGEIDNIPASFPNGAPNHSHSCYVSVEIGNQWVSKKDEEKLLELGWKSEQDGQYWLLYN